MPFSGGENPSTGDFSYYFSHVFSEAHEFPQPLIEQMQ